MAKKKTRKPYRKPTRTQPPRACKRTYATIIPDQHEEQLRALDQLPDDVLLLVMQHLDVDDLLACRLVCRRLVALALHPEVWRHRTLSTTSCDKNRLTCPVLRLAPCLHHVTVVLPLLKSVCGHVYTTTCAAGGLEVRDVHWADYSAGANATRLIQNQTTLGRLRRVVLKFHQSCLFGPAASTLFGALVSTPGLEQLRLTAWLDQPFVFSKTSTQVERVPSSIRKFHIAIKGSEAFTESVLRTHAATMEEVHIVGLGLISVYYRIPASTLQLFAGLPRLRVVSLHHDQPGMRVLAGSESLRTLNIVVGEGEEPNVNAVERLLRARPALQVNVIKGADDDDDYLVTPVTGKLSITTVMQIRFP